MLVAWLFCGLAIVFGVIVCFEVMQRSGINVYLDTLKYRKYLGEYNRGLLDEQSLAVARLKFENRLLKSDGFLRKSYYYWSIPACMISIYISVYVFSQTSDLAEIEQVSSASRISIADRATKGNKQISSVNNLPTSAPKVVGGDLNQLASRLAMKLTKDEKNGDGWLLLARTYQELGKFKESLQAYEKAAKLLPEDPQLYGDWIDMRVRENSSKWDQTSRDILEKANKRFPKNPRLLSLAGASFFEKKLYKEAITYWKAAQSYSVPDSKEFELARSNISEAERLSAQ